MKGKQLVAIILFNSLCSAGLGWLAGLVTSSGLLIGLAVSLVYAAVWTNKWRKDRKAPVEIESLIGLRRDWDQIVGSCGEDGWQVHLSRPEGIQRVMVSGDGDSFEAAMVDAAAKFGAENGGAN